MNALARPITHRYPLDRTLWIGLRCAVGLHPMARWERMTATLVEQHGRSKIHRDVLAQARECIGCGLNEIRLL